MELRCLCRYLLKQLTVLKFLMEGGREFQIVDPERERERERERGRQEKETRTQMHVFSKCHNICQCTGFGRSFVVQQRSQSYITPTPDITATRWLVWILSRVKPNFCVRGISRQVGNSREETWFHTFTKENNCRLCKWDHCFSPSG